MGTQITVTLSDAAYQRAQRLANLTARDVADVLAEAIEVTLTPLATPADDDRPVTELPDAAVLALADLRLPATLDGRLSRLLAAQQAGHLTDAQRDELHALMQIYQVMQLRKARGLGEAVARGLRPRLDAAA